jgi:hypothetical protein
MSIRVLLRKFSSPGDPVRQSAVPLFGPHAITLATVMSSIPSARTASFTSDNFVGGMNAVMDFIGNTSQGKMKGFLLCCIYAIGAPCKKRRN